MTDSLSFSNESQEHIHSKKEGNFDNKTIEEILSTLDNSIVDKANKLMNIKECRENYKTKIHIVNNPNESIRKIRTMKPLVLKKTEDLSFLEKEQAESIINKAIIMKHIPRIRRFYKKNKIPIPEDNIVIKANMNEIMNGLDSSNLRNNQLSNIGKILRGTRYNFGGIVLEEGKNEYTVIKNGDTYITTEKENPKGEIIIHKGEKVLMRHLEGNNVSPKIMKEALKNGIAFYEEYFNEEIKKIRYIKSGSWLWNREFRKFYKDKIWDSKNKDKKTNNIQETLELLEKIKTIFITHAEKEVPQTNKSENNDRFLHIPLRIDDTKYLSNKEENIPNKIKEIESRLNKKRIKDGKITTIGEKIIKENITPEIINQLVDKREEEQSDNEVKINGMIIARILRGKPIKSGICLLPIENIKKLE